VVPIAGKHFLFVGIRGDEFGPQIAEVHQILWVTKKKGIHQILAHNLHKWPHLPQNNIITMLPVFPCRIGINLERNNWNGGRSGVNNVLLTSP
jgi:hypothetical protein